MTRSIVGRNGCVSHESVCKCCSSSRQPFIVVKRTDRFPLMPDSAVSARADKLLVPRDDTCLPYFFPVLVRTVGYLATKYSVFLWLYYHRR